MEIFRHYYTAAEMATQDFTNVHLNNFGFCNLDGSKINFNWKGTATLNFRYGLDNKKQTYLYIYADGTSEHWTINLCSIRCHLSSGTNLQPCLRNTNTSEAGGGSPATVIFLPLKNNGFLLNVRSLNSYNGSAPNFSTWSNNSRDSTFCINTPSPSLNVKCYGTNTYSWQAMPTNDVLTFIGIPPCQGNINWTYLFYSDTPFYSYWSGAQHYDGRIYYKYIDYGDGKVLNLPFASNFIRKYNSSIPAYNELTYTNINENVCSMIKMPYDNGYIDGVYLLTTAPQQLEDATFFSFDGRNFLNVFDNYVVELPSST